MHVPVDESFDRQMKQVVQISKEKFFLAKNTFIAGSMPDPSR